jgi:uncharacterized protein (TIGR03382 family)
VAGLRIGDAERLAAAERLAWHFSHGRLDQAELDDRLGLAMRARTTADLTALFADLPPGEGEAAVGGGGRELPPAGRPSRPSRRGRTMRGLVVAVLLVVGVAVVANAVTHSLVAWALLVLLAVAWLRRRRVRE